jgi:hypothetical protein
MVTPADMVQAMTAGNSEARPSYAAAAKEAATRWPTPTRQDTAQSSGSNPEWGHGTTLTDAMRMWATPTSHDHKDTGGGNVAAEPQQPYATRAGDVVPFPPGPDDAAGWAEYLARYPGLEPAVEVAGPGGLMRRVLSPAFDEVLMAFPVGWAAVCDCVGPCACNRLDRLRCVGNAVCPDQSAEAFVQLWDRATGESP